MTLKITRFVVAAIGLLSLATMFNIWFNTTNAVAPMGIDAAGLVTRATARADIAGLFGGVGLIAILAAWKTDRNILAGALIVIGAAFAGRWISLLVDGSGPGVWAPIIVEAVLIGALLTAWRLWPAKT